MGTQENSHMTIEDQDYQPEDQGSSPEAPETSHDTSQQYDPRSSPSQPQPVHQPSQPQPVQSPWGVMENFRRLPQFQGQSEEQIARGLYESMQREQAATRHLAQYQQVMPYAQEYLTNKGPYEEWLRSRNNPAPQAQQALPQPEKKPWWSPPEIREAYKQYLVKDENGREVISPDAPLDARHALVEYQQYRADFAKKFLANPEEALGPMVQDLAAKQAQEIVQQTLSKRDNEEFVSRIEQENADWLFDKATGQVTPEGFLVHKYIEEANQLGIQGTQAKWDYATRNTERELLVQRHEEQIREIAQLRQLAAHMLQGRQAPPQQQPRLPPPPQQQALPSPQDVARQNMEYLRREASRSPSRSAGTASTDPRTPKPKQSFEQMLVAAAESKGLI